MSVRMPIEMARTMSAGIVRAIEPYCYEGRVEVAGSIRRGRPVCNDIDIVCMPNDLPGLKARAMKKARELVGGESNMLLELPNGIRIDLFFARPETRDLAGVEPTNWGSVLLCRTGSKEHNIYIAEVARARGKYWNPQRGVLSGDHKTILASESEKEIFHALKMAWIAPEARER